MERETSIEARLEEQEGTGETFDPQEAAEEGLSYTPPSDPPVIPSERTPAGVEIAAGFAPSMENTGPDKEILPEELDVADLEIQKDVGLALRCNSKTADLTDVTARVKNEMVHLYGIIPDQDDIGLVYDVVSDLEGMVDVFSHLRVKPEA